MKAKSEKKKPYRSAWSNAFWSFREMLHVTPQSFWLMAAGIPLGVFLAWAEIRLPALVVAEVTTGQTFAHAATAIGILLGMTVLAVALRDFCATVLTAYLSRFRFSQFIRLDRKSMHCFYQTYEKKETRDLHDRAQMATWMSNGTVKLLEMPQQSTNLLKSVLCYLLFGTVISFASPFLLLLLTLAPLINWFALRAYQKYEYRTRAARTDVESKLSYVTGRTADFATAKDIRIYGMSDWLRSVFTICLIGTPQCKSVCVCANFSPDFRTLPSSFCAMAPHMRY